MAYNNQGYSAPPPYGPPGGQQPAYQPAYQQQPAQHYPQAAPQSASNNVVVVGTQPTVSFFCFFVFLFFFSVQEVVIPVVCA